MLLSGTNCPKMGFEKCLKTVEALYSSAALTQVADPGKTQNVHFSQLMSSSRCVSCRSAERTEVQETCRDLLEPTSQSLKPMANVKQIGGDRGCEDIHCLCFPPCTLIVRSRFPLSSIPRAARVRNFINKCFHCQCSTYSNRPLNTVFGFTACHHHLSTPVARNT